MKSILCLLSSILLSMLALADDPKPKLDGSWELSTGVMAGNDLPDEVIKSIKLKITGNDVEFTIGQEKIKGTATLGESTFPNRIKFRDKEGPNAGKTIHAIYELTKNEMKICYAMEGIEYPKEFTSPADSKLFLAVYKRTR